MALMTFLNVYNRHYAAGDKPENAISYGIPRRCLPAIDIDKKGNPHLLPMCVPAAHPSPLPQERRNVTNATQAFELSSTVRNLALSLSESLPLTFPRSTIS
jgi:hypothetical protein